MRADRRFSCLKEFSCEIAISDLCHLLKVIEVCIGVSLSMKRSNYYKKIKYGKKDILYKCNVNPSHLCKQRF